MRLLVVIALFSITPGFSRAMEIVVDLIVHTSVSETADDAGECREHTCTPFEHNCSCHGSMAAQAVSAVVTVANTPHLTERSHGAIPSVFGQASDPPPLRPPIG